MGEKIENWEKKGEKNSAELELQLFAVRCRGDAGGQGEGAWANGRCLGKRFSEQS